jgi:hypothetical protein
MNYFIKKFALLFVLVFSSTVLFAQTGNIVYVQTWDFEMPEDGSWAEFDSLATIVNDNVVSKNDNIISQRIVGHLWGSDSGQLIVIREYAKIEDLVVDNDIGSNLFEAWLTNEEDRKTFGGAYGKYWQGRHSDEIYQEFAGARK